MPPKTNSDRIQELLTEVARISAKLEEREKAMQHVLARMEADQHRSDGIVSSLQSEVAVLKQRADYLEKQLDEKDRRRWQMGLAFLGCLLTLVVQVVLLFLKK